MADIKDEIAAFEEMQSRLEADYLGKWVLIHDRALINSYDSFENAASDAAAKFGSGPYLIRQVGSTTSMTLPSSVMYHRHDADSKLRVS
jgi:hypothetical protein